MLIVQAQSLINAGHPSTLIVPLTTNLIHDAEPLRIRVHAQSLLQRDSDLLIEQLRAIDNRRLKGTPLARVDERTLQRVAAAIKEVLDIA